MTLRTGIHAAVVASLGFAVFSAATTAPPFAHAQDKSAPANKSKAKKDADNTITDKEITQAITRRLKRNAAIPFDGIDVATNKGIVTFSGSVDSLLAKDLTTDIALATKGVRSVVNQLKVTTGTMTDEQIRAAVVAALAADSYEITTKVDNGVVTLNGKVES